MTTVRIPPALRAETGGAREVTLEAEDVRTLLEALVERYPAIHLTAPWSYRDFNAVTEVESLRGALR